MANKGKDIPRDLTDRALGRALGRKIARLERHVRELEVASQAAHRSVEDGSIDVYDDNDVLRERIGKQADGSFGRKAFTGDIPPAPTEPDVVVISDGVVAVTWDGRWEERYSHVGWRNVQIHMSDDLADMPGDRDTQVGALFAPRGGTIVAVTESDDDNPVYVWLVGMNDAGQTGDPSVAVLVDELDEDALEEEEEELLWEENDGHTLTTGDIAAGSVTFGMLHIPEVESVLAWWHPGGLTFAGVPQAPGVDFTVDTEGPTVTWSLSGFEKVGDRLRLYYPYYSSPAPAPTLVGVTMITGPTTSVALPAGTQAGDQLILAETDWTSASCSDGRMTLHDTFPGQFRNLGNSWVGTADGSGTPVAVNFAGTAGRVSGALIAVRGQLVTSPAPLTDVAPDVAASGVAPQATGAAFTVAIALLRNGSLTTGLIGHSAGGYTVIGFDNSSSKTCCVVAVWDNAGVEATSPADTFTFSGGIDAWAIATYKIAGV